ncbi:unnamed protein product [Diamesa tonsa]
MRNRQPFKLTKLIIFYNIVQITANFVCASTVLYNTYLYGGYSLLCAPMPRGDFSPTALIVRDMSYTYFIGKIIDLLDTVFFVLRKKNSQITFLHVYHHALMVLSSYVYVKFYSGGGHPVSLGIINGYVHCFVYGYYLLTAFKPELKGSMWWKKYITVIQLVQFAILMLHFGVPLFMEECCYPKHVLGFIFMQNAFMFAMFFDFYIKTYVRKGKKSIN